MRALCTSMRREQLCSVSALLQTCTVLYCAFKMFNSINSSAACDVRSVIRFLSSRNLSAAEIHRQICEVYGDTVMSERKLRKTVRWLWQRPWWGPLYLSSWRSLNSRTLIRTLLSLLTVSPYTSQICRWISAADRFLDDKNRITERTSQAADELIELNILKAQYRTVQVCNRAETKHSCSRGMLVHDARARCGVRANN